MLETIVFICGACVMILELVAGRLLAPYLGTSLFIWTSLIGVILGCMSIGYYWGGAISERSPNFRTFGWIIFYAGLSVSVVAFVSEPVLVVISLMIPSIRLASVLATLILMGIPAILLGMISPYAVRLKVTTLEKTGSTAGKLYAV